MTICDDFWPLVGLPKTRIAKMLCILHYLYKEKARFIGIFLMRSSPTGIEPLNPRAHAADVARHRRQLD